MRQVAYQVMNQVWSGASGFCGKEVPYDIRLKMERMMQHPVENQTGRIQYRIWLALPGKS